MPEQYFLNDCFRWSVVPISLLCSTGLLEAGKPVWIAVAVTVFFAVVAYASGCESGFYKRRLNELEVLKRKLEAA